MPVPQSNALATAGSTTGDVYWRFECRRDERFCRMWEFYLISAEMMFRTGSQEVFHMQLARKRDAAPIVRDYVTDVQRSYEQLERSPSLVEGTSSRRCL